MPPQSATDSLSDDNYLPSTDKRRKSEMKVKKAQSFHGGSLGDVDAPTRRKSSMKKAGSRKISVTPCNIDSTQSGEDDQEPVDYQRSLSIGGALNKVPGMKGSMSRALSYSVLDTPGKTTRPSSSSGLMGTGGGGGGGGLEMSSKIPWIIKKMPPRIASNIESFDLNNDKVLGVGLMGTVRLARYRHHTTPAYVAIKSIRKDYITRHNDERHVNNERDILLAMQSPFCIQLFGTCQDDTHIYFTMEYAAGGELFRRILRKDGFSPNVAKFYLCEVYLAIFHVQSLGYVYRDLKPENVMLDEYGHCKLVDFGFCTKPNADGMCRTNVGTPAYLSPEQLNGKFTKGYTKIVDWWSLGVLLYELLSGKTPFCKKNSESSYEIYLRVLKGKISYSRRFSAETKALINELLHPDIATRLTDPVLIKHHAFFADADWGALEKRQIIPPFVPKLSMEGDMQHFDDWGRFEDKPTKPKKMKKTVTFVEGF